MISDVTYTEEEEALSAEFCDAINADKELQQFFRERVGSILGKFAAEIIMAWRKTNKQLAKETTQEAGEMLKALTMHMYVKVVVKKKILHH